MTLTLHASALEGSSSTGPVTAIQAAASKVAVYVDTTAEVSLTSLDIDIQWSFDATVWWELASQDSMTQITGTGTEAKVFDVKAPWVRINYAIVGTSVTFSVMAHAVN